MYQRLLTFVRFAAVIALVAAGSSFLSSTPAFAQLCPPTSTQSTCACPTSGAGATCFNGTLFRSSTNDCGTDGRPCASNQVFDCSTLSCACNTSAYPCGGCTAATSTVGASCGSPTGGTYTDQCGTCSCAAGSTYCSSSNKCVANRTCPSGSTWDVCSDTCVNPYVLISPSTQQSGYVNVTGDIAAGGDAYLPSGKAIRVDGSGTTQLNVGNWGSGATGFAMNVFGTVGGTQFCINGSCRASWPSTADFDPTYVNASGDTMTGTLNLTGGSSDLYVAGSIGVGTTSPSTRLDISGTTASAPQILVENSSTYGMRLGLTSSNVGFIGSTNATPVQIQTGGAPRMYFDTSGNVGIGTTSPGARLDVNGTAKMTGLTLTTGATNGYVLTSDASGNATWQASSGIGGTGITGYLPMFASATTLTSSLVYDDGTHVGVGTASPSALLSVGAGSAFTVDASGNVSTSGTIADNNGNLTTSATTGSLFNANATTVNVGGAATTVRVGASSGTMTINNPVVTLANGTNLNMNGNFPSIATSVSGTAAAVFNSNATTGQLFGGATAIYIGAPTGMTAINNSLGVGTTTPAARLDVNGTAKMTGLLLPTGATNGYILTSDASGNATWHAAPATGVGGSGTANYVPMFTAATTLGNSNIVENSTATGIGTTSPPRFTLEVNGPIVNTAAYNANNTLNAFDVGVGSIGANSIFGISAICTGGNSSTNCFGYNGTVLGTGNANATNNIPDSGNVFFNGGNVGIGTNSPSTKLFVNGTATVNGNATVGNGSVTTGLNTSGANYGAIGSSGYIGLYGSGTTMGVYGTGSYGVWGSGTAEAVYGQGGTYGLYGTGTSIGAYATGPTGVQGAGTNYGVQGSGGTYGVYGTGTSYGVQGNSSGTYGVGGTGGTYGVYGTGSSYGVYGGGVDGVYGSGSNVGVYGTGSNDGLYGSGPTGVYGVGTNYAVYAVGGTYGTYSNGASYGVFAVGNGTGTGVYGTSTGTGPGLSGYSASGHGVDAGGAYGIYSTGTTNYFSSNVGIATTSPAEKLDVYGNVRISGSSTPTLLFRTSGYPSIWGGRIMMLDYGDGMGLDFDTSTGSDVWSTQMVVRHNGNVGIGTTSPAARLDVITGGGGHLYTSDYGCGSYGGIGGSTTLTGCTNYALLSAGNDTFINRPSGYPIRFREANGDQMIILSGGNVGIGTTSPDSKLTVNGSADKPGGGSWGTYSDARLKDVSGAYTTGLDAVMKLNPIRYRYKQDNPLGLPSDQDYVGLVAQDVQPAVPDAVTASSSGYLEVNNDPIIWSMLNAIKELKAQNDALKARVDALEQK